MLNYGEFISVPHCMLIAPAGYGKTHTIVECLNHTKDVGKQLILTHTHAGVASIKEKIKKGKISSSSYNVETITSFAQRYVMSFYTGTDIPEQSDSKKYYSFIIEKATALFRLNPIKSILLNNYSGLFVDEYQDCTLPHHTLVLTLSELFPTRILGDYLQGIFGFNGESLVNLEDAISMGSFANKKSELVTPYRWLNGNNEPLGNDLKEIRSILINKSEIDLANYKSIEVNLIQEKDLHDPRKEYYKIITRLLSESSLLLLHHDSTSINPRLKLVKKFNNRFSLIESIDDKDFYSLSRQADSLTKAQAVLFIKGFCEKLFNKTGVSNWFNKKGFKKKTTEADKLLLEPIFNKINQIGECISFLLISEILKEISCLPEMKCYRKELFNSFCKALDEAESESISVYQAMTDKRNTVRRIGRKILGRCIGTTLLTKGLEFDVVVLINAHKFECPKHLYVAMTRATKRLIIFTDTNKLNPYKIAPHEKQSLQLSLWPEGL